MLKFMETAVAKIASLIGEPSRAKILIALMGGKALTATELSMEAGITPQTASSHLSKLVDGQLLVLQKQGRHKYFHIKDRQVADLLETLLGISSKKEYSNVKTGPVDPLLRKARVCYDHLAGELGVLLFNSLKKQNYIEEIADIASVTTEGELFFASLGVNMNELKKSKRSLCKSCLDWSERQNHLSGSLGVWVLNDLFNSGWGAKNLDSRAISLTTKGLQDFKNKYGILE